MTAVEQPEFTQHPETDAETFVQWKGTDVCIDVRCPCGNLGHFDGSFAYHLRCPCGRVYRMGTAVRAILLPDDAGDQDPQDLDRCPVNP